jgi:serine/threonine protein phosphatase 1
MNRLIIGDIHGCYDELQELLDRAALSCDEEIIALGDIVDRGPDSPKVLEFFRTHPKARSLMGNHERKHIRAFRGEIKPSLSQVISRTQWADAYPAAVAQMEAFPYFVDLPEATLVHGYLEPGLPLDQQQEVVLAGSLGGSKRLHRRCSDKARHWYEMHDGQKPLIVGHQDYGRNHQPVVIPGRFYGIDTSCSRGGALTGILLPAFKILSVPSRGDHWSAMKQRFGHLMPAGAEE